MKFISLIWYVCRGVDWGKWMTTSGKKIKEELVKQCNAEHSSSWKCQTYFCWSGSINGLRTIELLVQVNTLISELASSDKQETWYCWIHCQVLRAVSCQDGRWDELDCKDGSQGMTGSDRQLEGPADRCRLTEMPCKVFTQYAFIFIQCSGDHVMRIGKSPMNFWFTWRDFVDPWM